MKIGIIGTGNMGSAFARRATASGHEVVLTSRDAGEAQKLAATIGSKARAVPQNAVAREVDLVIAATPYSEQANALRAAGDLSGKLVIEISNPMTPDASGLAVGHTTSAAEEIARAVPGAKVVKAFNTIFAQLLAEGPVRGDGGPVQVFYAGDDDVAKRSVRAFIQSLGFEPVDAGPLRNARYLEPLGMLNIWFGYMAKMGKEVAPAWVRHE